MQTSSQHISDQLRNLLPAEKKSASWGSLSEQFPWYPMLHLLRAAEHPNEKDLIQKAALYSQDILRLHAWISEIPKKPGETTFQAAPPEVKPVEASPETIAIALDDLKPMEEEDENFESETEDDLSASAGEPPLRMPDLSKVLSSPPDERQGLSFEPFHTVDYFASQGIKVDKEAEKQLHSPLDRQVKSFTDWLKTMKKLSYQPIVNYSDPLVDAQARNSLTNKEIVTEAMAEVWIKQGNFAMASQIFAKLMLQHPEKTPYFAARLTELKEKQ